MNYPEHIMEGIKRTLKEVDNVKSGPIFTDPNGGVSMPFFDPVTQKPHVMVIYPVQSIKIVGAETLLMANDVIAQGGFEYN